MRLRPDTLGLLAAVLALLIGALTSGPFQDRAATPAPGASVRRPLPVEPPSRDALPPPSNRDPELKIQIGAKRNSSGTAFPVAAGVWMTARHVADGCAKIGILTGPRRAVRGSHVMVHDNADLALFRAPLRSPPVVVGGDDLRVGEAGFHFGFPQGVPGAVRTRLIGRGTLRESGRYSTREPILAWAEIRRVPDTDTPLSGISGGPVFDSAGRLVGVTIAGSIRRGRSYTAAPSSMRELLARAKVRPPATGPVPALNDDTFAAVGERLRKDLIVTKAVCFVK